MLTRNTPPPTSAPSPPRRHPLRTSSRYPLPPLAPHLCQLSPHGQLPPQAVPRPFFIPHHPSANFRPLSAATPPPPRIVLLPSTTPRSIPLPTSPRLHHHAACFCPAPPAPALFRKGRRGPPQGRAPAPIAQIRTTDPSPEHAQKKERHPLPDAAPWNGCAASTRGRRPYRPLRAGRRTRPAYWPQSTPR